MTDAPTVHPTPPGIGRAGVTRLALRGAAWTASSTMLVRLANIAVIAVVARLLSRADFGVFAIALAVHMVVASLAELGLASAIARSADEPEDIAPTVTTLSLVVSGGLAVAMALFAGGIADAVGSPAAEGPIRILAVSLFLTGVFAVPGAQLAREFKQDKLFVATLAGFIPANTLLVVMAFNGGGAEAFAWSRVIGQLVAGAVMVAFLTRRYRPGLVPGKVVGLLLFGLPLAMANLVNWSLLNADYLIIGRYLSDAQVGTYMIAFGVAGWTTAILGSVLNGVVVPTFARLGTDRASMTDGLVTAVRLVGAVALPVGMVTIALAEPLVTTVYGPKWYDSAAVLSVLAIYGMLYALSLLLANVLVSTGHTARLLAVQLLWIACLVPAMVWSVSDGLVGVAWAHVAVMAAVTLPGYLFALRDRVSLPPLRTLRAVGPALVAAALAGLTAHVVAGLPERTWQGFLLGGFSAVAVYVVVLVPLLLRQPVDAEDPLRGAALGVLAVVHRLALRAQRLAARLPRPVRRVISAAVPRAVRPAWSPSVQGWDTPLVGDAGAGLDGLGPVAPESSGPVRAPVLDPDRARLGLVTGSLDVGGMDAFVVFLARGLAARGWEVTVLVASDDPALAVGRAAASLREEGFPVVVSDAERLGADLTDVDVVSLHGAPDWAVAEAADRGLPVVETLHGMHTLYWSDPAALAHRAAALTRVVAVSDLAAQQFLGLVPTVPTDRVVTIPNGVWSRHRPPEVRAAARAALGLGDEFVFLSLARHCLQKNTYALVAAFEEVAARLPDAHLVIAGRPDDPAYFAQAHARATGAACADRIHLRDHHPDPGLLLAAADCFVLDSFFEGWSLASMDALTAGLPVVLTEVGGAREQLAVPDSPGVLVANPVGDPLAVDWPTISEARFRDQANRTELVAAMVEVAADRQGWVARREAIAAESAVRFSPDRCLEQHAAVLVAARQEHRVPVGPGVAVPEGRP